jgi:hypothetical protein
MLSYGWGLMDVNVGAFSYVTSVVNLDVIKEGIEVYTSHREDKKMYLSSYLLGIQVVQWHSPATNLAPYLAGLVDGYTCQHAYVTVDEAQKTLTETGNDIASGRTNMNMYDEGYFYGKSMNQLGTLLDFNAVNEGMRDMTNNQHRGKFCMASAFQAASLFELFTGFSLDADYCAAGIAERCGTGTRLMTFEETTNALHEMTQIMNEFIFSIR